jgi:hypothetical protein
MCIDPDLAVFKNLLFPDRNTLLEGVDNIPAGIESVGAVGRGNGDQNRNITNGQIPFPVDNRVLSDIPALAGFVGNFLHFRQRHPVVGFVFQPFDGPVVGAVANRTKEKSNRPRPHPSKRIGKPRSYRWDQS